LKLIGFIEKSEGLFESQEVLELLPPNSYLQKERALMLAKNKQYEQALDMAIG
jgi:hypothetical protein